MGWTKKNGDPPGPREPPDIVDQFLETARDGLSAMMRPWATALLFVLAAIAVLLTMIAAMLATVVVRGHHIGTTLG
jgi:hypothetical protein